MNISANEIVAWSVLTRWQTIKNSRAALRRALNAGKRSSLAVARSHRYVARVYSVSASVEG